jgi:AcrR family transcriptional regulator
MRCMVSRDEQRRQTRQRLYECALAVFRRDGVTGCRTDDIAKAAGVSRGTFYFHFPTKEHVLLERMRETEEQICGVIEAMPHDEAIDSVLDALITEMAAIWEPDPQLLPDLSSAALRHVAANMSDQDSTRLRSTLSGRFSSAAARGEIQVLLPSEVLGDFFLGHTLGGLLAWYGNPVLPLKGVLEAVTYMFWHGAKAPTDPQPGPSTSA